MAHDQHLLWTTKGQKIASKEQLDPHLLYDFFSAANAAKVQQRTPMQRIKSATPRLGGKDHDSIVESLLGSYVSLRNPSPTPATSRPLSSRSGRSSVSLRSVQKAKPAPSISPSSLYLGLHKARCKSAPPRPADYYLPQRPKTAKSRGGSATSSSRSAPKRAWQNRISSAKGQHSLLSRDEVEKRHKERCKSAPLPYDFSSIEVVTSIPKQGSEFQKLKAFTRPLTCMPDVIQNVLSHNGLRHCCSAYQRRPKTTSSSRQQFWPVARPAVFRRGDVPKYLHFVKPLGSWETGEVVRPKTAPDGTLSEIDNHYDEEQTVLYEDQFFMPATSSEASMSDREYEEEMPESKVEDLNEPQEPDLADEYLGEENETGFPVTPDATAEPTEPVNQGFEVVITKVEHSPVESPSPDDIVQEPEVEIPIDEQDGDLQIVVPEIPQWVETTYASPVEEECNDVPEEQDTVPQSDQEPVEPVKELEDEPPNMDVINMKESEVEEPVSQINQVKFSESLILTSYKSPQPKKEKKEQPKKPLSILKPGASKVESASPVCETPAPVKKDTPVVERKVRDAVVKPPIKPLKQETKTAEERTEEAPKLEPEVLPKPEYIRAPGAYRMYHPKDLQEHHLERKRESKPVKKSLINSTALPPFKPSPESTAVMTTILDEQKWRKDGMKPWLQGRLALSKQTSRFELPMDIRLLEAMTPMEYLTKYCIISTRRKALFKHIFLKVDKDRDNIINFKEMDKGLKEIHVDSITTEQVKKLIEMVEENEKSTFNLTQFSAIAAFSERLLFSENIIMVQENGVHGSKNILEEADFCGLKSKLCGFPVNPTVRKILDVL